MSNILSDYPALHDATLPHLPWELYQRWQGYGDNTAIVTASGELLSYRQLVQRVESKYAAIGQREWLKGGVIALGGGMGSDMIATLLACWLHGLTVAMLDDNLPQARRQRLLEIAAPRLLIHSDDVTAEFSGINCCRYVELTGTPQPITQFTPADAAYIVFTSGSTGDPKAILGSHMGLAHFICWQSQEFGITPQDRFAQLTAVGFDVIYRSVFTPLFSGAQLWLPPHAVSEGAAMLAWLRQSQISVVHLVPTIIKAWQALGPQTALPDLRWIFSAGEMLHGKVLQTIYQQWAFTGQVINLYGPSETTLAKCFYRCQPEDALSNALPVGTPLPNTEVWIMEGQRRCAPGESGEVVIRTPYRAQRYLGGTADAFRPTSNAQHPNDQLYYTGDIGHYDPQGLLHLHGRRDDQVKINGVRIELGEIEAFLHRLPQVQEAAVCHHDGLVAYLAAPASLPANAVYNALNMAFPAEMQPRVVLLRSLPKNANGKVDRQALRDSQNNGAENSPKNDRERQLNALCLEVSQRTQLGMDEDLRHAGLQSLQQMMLIGKIQQAFAVTLTLRNLHQHPTLRALAHFISQQQACSLAAIPACPAEQTHFPASRAQARLYALDTLGCGNAYNILSAYTLRGADPQRFKTALAATFEHYAVLRTGFQLNEGRLEQQVLSQLPLPLWEAAIEQQQIATTLDELNAPFDLQQPPLVRFGLFTLQQPDTLLFAYAVHHSLFDGPSHQLFLDTLWQYYAQETPPALPALHYHDYASHEAQREAASATSLDFWQNTLSQQPPLLTLPTDRPRPLQKGYRGDVVSATLSADKLSRRLAGTAITRFQLLLAAFSLLMGRYAEQIDVLLGVPVNGRRHPELLNLPGMFAESLPLLINTSGQQSVKDYLSQVHQTLLSAMEHTCPLETIVQALALPRDASRSPLFDVMFTLAEPVAPCPDECGIRLEPYHCPSQTAKFDLLAQVEDHGDRLTIHFEYDSDLFERQTIERMLQNYLTLLTGMLDANERTPLAQLNGICTNERQQLLGEMSHTPFSLPRDKHFLDYFRQQCARTPGAVAVVGEDRSLTYRALDQASERLAWQLHEAGVSTHAVVPVVSERNSDIVVAILAVLKLNAVYLPIDPATPDSRISYMLSDSRAEHILAQPTLHPRMAALAPQAQTLAIDCSYADAPAPVPVRICGNDPCVIFYTSGSTGTPKGVTHSHMGLINFALYENEQNAISADDRVAFYANLAFDVSMWSLLLPLLRGATVHVLPESSRYALDDIHAYFEQHGITVALFPTQLCEAFMQQPAPPQLRLLWTAGEKLQQVPVNQTYRLINGYGPTEYTGCTTRYEVTGPEVNIPIGRPLGNTWVYVLDADLNLQPLGAPGELCIAGLQMTQGYLNQPEHTAAYYAVNPYADGADNLLLYRTGDVAKWLPNGNLVYLGRRDDQVKIRGFRVEPQEVEQALLALPTVTQAAVLAHRDAHGRYKLAAYLATETPHSLPEIHAALRETLPDYMLPAHCLSLPELPVNANGKVDKAALKALPLTTATSQFAAPVGVTEKLLAELWQKHLSTEAVGRDDDFFVLGGNSISAITMGAALNRRLGKQIPLKGLFQFSRLAEFSRYVEDIACQSIQTNDLAIRHDADNAHQPFGLTDVQRAYLIGREATFELGGVSTHVYREDRFSRLDVEWLNNCLNQLVQRHPALRTVYSLEGSQSVLADVPALQIAVQDLRHQSPECQQAALLGWREELEQQIFDVSRFPLFEFRVTQYDDHCLLHFSFDALIMDALSMRIFMRELGELYRYPQQALPPLSINFRDYQLAYEQLKTTERYREDQQYWQQRLPELPFGPALATACRPDSISAPSFARQSFSLSADVWQALQARIRQAKISPTVPFLTLYGQVLARWSANQHFLINLTLFQREDLHPETQRLLGDFTVLSLFEYQQRQEAIGQLLQGVQTRLWDDLSHTLFTGLEVQAALARQHQSDGNKPIAPVVLTSLLGIPLNDDRFLSDDYQGREYARTQTSQVWLDNKIYEKDGGLVIEWDYVSQLFSEQQISDMLNAYRQAIVALANDDWDRPLSIALPSADEQLLQRYNNSDCTECMPTTLLHQQFLHAAGQFPAATAVITPQADFSYQHIADKAAQLAHHLQAKGVARHERVMICAEKGAALVCGPLGIMMADAVFVPVNVQWPVTRLRDIIAQAGIRHVILTRQQQQRLQQTGGLGEEITCHLIDGDELAAYDHVPPTTHLELDNPAYVIFTSGSTGKPKGVCISHRGVMNTLQDINQRLALSAADRTLCISNISFDLAIYDIFGPLLLGAAVVMPNDGALEQPDSLLQLMDESAVSVYNSAPAIMALLVQSAGDRRFDRVRHVLLSGDFIPLDLPERIRRAFPTAALLSLGGATEGSIWSIGYPVSHIEPHWTSIPYGMPLRNQQVWILDANRQPCPIGVPGEIYLAGCGVALGYEADAEKTAAHFGHLPNGQRYYRTGDQGVMNRAGHVEILGRLDHQVKINGFRIELGEIDSVLQAHPAVQTSLSRVMTQDTAQKSLTAYVVPKVFDHLAFKLEKRGIRKDASTARELQPLTPPVILADTVQRMLARKSYRHYQAERLTLEQLQPLLFTTIQPVDRALRLTPERLWADLALLLTPLRAFKHQTDGLNKHLYPSAGGLYPVRTYVVLSRAWGDDQGYYYYHPENHALVPIAGDAELLPETGIYLQLNAYLPAIEPEYHQHAQAYSRLEAGCMQALLAQHCGLSPVETLPLASGCENELPLASYRLAPQQEADIALPLPENTLLLLKTDTNWESYCFQKRRFQRCDAIPLTFHFGQGEHNDAIISSAAALLLLPEMPDLQQGRFTQCVSEHLLNAAFGSCLLGQFELGDQLAAYTAQRTFCGALAIGKVAADAMTNGEVENIEQTAAPTLTDELRAYLLRQLPDYMVPQDIICLPTLPLTANGKVDVKALPQPQGQLSDSEICPAGDQYEERLLELWSEVLKKPVANHIHADFFALGGNSLDAILLSIKMSQRFVRKISTALVYKHRTIAQQARAVIECVLQPTQDFIALNQSDAPKRLVLFPTSDSGAEAYHQLAQALAADVEVIGISHFLINYPESVTSDWSVALDFYCRQVENIVKQAPDQPVWLGGWSLGGNIAIAVAERLAKTCPQIRPQLIIFDSLPEYNTVEREVRENTTDVWSSYHPDNIMYRQFIMAGYSRRHYFHFVDCQFDHLSAMRVAQSSKSMLLIKCMEPIGYFYSDIPDNGWGSIARGVTVHRVEANHINLLIDQEPIRQVADIIRQALQQDEGNDDVEK
ncbi:Tyrocidine synthase III [Serratia quinivorans]|uniref:non-ribosomal peptide synthetase n=1 Tax=Serratia quinivorans TaxID=137545 RepID=UPI00217CB432|nr:non-ribosomal peptide synthetase [Serratia quinivorans]CAI1565611.1 Tyrocidine synthase III [Serratia quinivorans]CAI1697541.1 Tyrocidine synthase III [Serratia quinivorans]